jgi:alkylation response protein AidB-like acyl-CoA dehydrogenase
VAPLERVKRLVRDGQTRASDVWAGLCELDLAGILSPRDYGGVGCSLLDAALVAEVLGSRAAPVPFAAAVVMAPLAVGLAGSPEQKSRWLPALAEGRLLAGAAIGGTAGSRETVRVVADRSKLTGRALFVLDFDADVYLVADDNRSLYLVEAGAPGLALNPFVTIDKTRAVGELVFENVAAELLPASRDAEICARVLDAGRIALAADTLGAAQAMLDRAVAYSKERVQFGRAIGSFQAVKHMCAEMAARLEPCRAMTWYAAHAFDALPDEARLAACHAKAHLAEVGTFVARTSTEVHGGIGFTEELGLHLWFKRIGANRQLLGGPAFLREQAARLQQWV